MPKSKVSWQNDLGSPTAPGTRVLPGLGEVTIDQSAIDRARGIGGALIADLIEVTSHDSQMREFIVGQFSPA